MIWFVTFKFRNPLILWRRMWIVHIALQKSAGGKGWICVAFTDRERRNSSTRDTGRRKDKSRGDGWWVDGGSSGVKTPHSRKWNQFPSWFPYGCSTWELQLPVARTHKSRGQPESASLWHLTTIVREGEYIETGGHVRPLCHPHSTKNISLPARKDVEVTQGSSRMAECQGERCTRKEMESGNGVR